VSEKQGAQRWRFSHYQRTRSTAQKSVSFSILSRCHTDFEFENVALALQDIAEYVRQKGGTFEGDNNEGFYVINNERITYQVNARVITLYTRFPPETVQTSTTRGVSAPLQIDLAMSRSSIPRQIAQTGDKITQAGGSFTGDTKGGNFAVQKPVEVIGTYRVANENVTVSITKYPSLFAGTIKSKIKEYFSE